MATVGYGQNISQAPLRINVAPAEDALVVDISGETYPRWALKGSGSIVLSAGTIAPDAGIRRDGTGIVAITDGSNGYGDLFIRNTLAFSGTGPYKVRSATGNDLTLETTMANAIVFSTAQTPRWSISSSGHLLASADNAYDIGSTASRARYAYIASGLGIGISTAPAAKLHVIDPGEGQSAIIETDPFQTGEALMVKTTGGSIYFAISKTAGRVQAGATTVQPRGGDTINELFKVLTGGGTICLQVLSDTNIRVAGTIYPFVDNASDLGIASIRFRDAYFANMVSVRKDQGDYGGNFATYTPPAGREGAFMFAVDTNPTNPGRRMYVYLNGAWRYVNLS